MTDEKFFLKLGISITYKGEILAGLDENSDYQTIDYEQPLELIAMSVSKRYIEMQGGSVKVIKDL
jgi:hypothetical protein